MSFLILLADSLNIIGYIIYYFQMKRGDSEPKSVSWSLWSFLSIFNFASYREKNNGLASYLFLIDAFACIFICFHVYFHKKENPWNREDFEIFALGFLSMIVCWHWKDAEYANMVICVAYFFSFYPIIKQVWKDRYSENKVSWWVCTWAYALSIIELLLEGEDKFINYLSFVVLGILHFAVALAAKKKEVLEPVKNENKSPVD